MCQCHEFGDYVETVWDDSPSFDAGFVTVGTRADTELRRCEDCGQHWQLDVGRGGLAIRVTDAGSWADFDDRPTRLQHLVDSHGGVVEGVCQWSGCDRQPLKGNVLCPHHAYPMLSNDMDG